MVSKLKRPSTEWEKIFAIYTADKEMITTICRQLKKLNSPQINEPIKKWAIELNRILSKFKWPKKKNVEKCSRSLAINEVEIKTTLRFHLTPVRNSYHQKHHQQQMLARMRKEPSYTACENVR
jgi:hypothetical protein